MAVEVVDMDMDTDTDQLKLLSSSTVVVVDTDTAVIMDQAMVVPFHHHFWQRLLVVSTARTAHTAHMDIHTVDMDTVATAGLIRQQSFLQLLVVCKSIHWNNKQMKNEEKQNENSNLNAKLCPIANTNLQLKFA